MAMPISMPVIVFVADRVLRSPSRTGWVEIAFEGQFAATRNQHAGHLLEVSGVNGLLHLSQALHR